MPTSHLKHLCRSEVPLKYNSYCLRHLGFAFSLLWIIGCEKSPPSTVTSPAPEPTTTNVAPPTAPLTADAPPSVSPPPPKTATADYIGSWQSERIEQDGKTTPNSAGAKLVFTETELSISGRDHAYQINNQSKPVTINFTTPEQEKPFEGIIELKDGQLLICYSAQTGNPRPTDFATQDGDGRILFVLKRADALPTADPNAIPPELQQAIDRAIENLEGNNVEAYVSDFLAPDELAAIQKSGWEKTLDFVSKQQEKTLATLKALKTMTPSLDKDTTRAVFDLSQVDIEGGASFPKMNFRKVDGKWYLTNR